MTQQRMRIAVVGANGTSGLWADRAHVPAIAALEEAELAAVCTTHEESAKRAQSKYRARLAFWDVNALLRSPEIDMITVAIRVPLHHPVTMAALEHGKHVMCEWPLALDVGQAEAMSSLAHERALGHAVGTQAYFSPGLMYGKELLEQGYVGKPLQFHMTHFTSTGFDPRPAHRAWVARGEDGGGATIVGGHALAVLRWYLGEVAAVSGLTGTLVPEVRWSDTGEASTATALDTMACLARLEDGTVGSVHTSHAANGAGGFRFGIYGTEGRLLVESGGMVQFSPARVYGSRGNSVLEELPVPERFTQVTTIDPAHQGFQVAQMLRTFIGSIRAKSSFHPGFDDAIRLHGIIDAIKRSAQSNAWETPAN